MKEVILLETFDEFRQMCLYLNTIDGFDMNSCNLGVFNSFKQGSMCIRLCFGESNHRVCNKEFYEQEGYKAISLKTYFENLKQ